MLPSIHYTHIHSIILFYHGRTLTSSSKLLSGSDIYIAILGPPNLENKRTSEKFSLKRQQFQICINTQMNAKRLSEFTYAVICTVSIVCSCSHLRVLSSNNSFFVLQTLIKEMWCFILLYIRNTLSIKRLKLLQARTGFSSEFSVRNIQDLGSCR